MLRMCAEIRMRLHAPNVSDFFFTDFDKNPLGVLYSCCLHTRQKTREGNYQHTVRKS